jgi:uncharacterized protein (TIGR02996 family)
MTEQDFIDAILAEPDDDVPRLIYADFLEERGNPRSDFIRLQVELATLAPPPRRNRMYGNPVPQPRDPRDAAHFRRLWERQMNLLLTHCAEWVEPLIGQATGVIFERGCIEGITAQPQAFATYASLWYQSMPIRQLCIAAPPSMDDWQSFLESPSLLNIRTLDLGYAQVDANLRQKLRSSPYLKNVRI